MITSKLHPALNTPIDDNIDGIQINHNKVLADLVESNLPLIAIAKDHKLTLAQLIAWAAQPAVRSLLDAADELATRIADHKAKQGRTGAVQTLIGHSAGLCESPRDRDLASRAARTLVRITIPPKTTRARRITANAGSAGAPQPGGGFLTRPPSQDSPHGIAPLIPATRDRLHSRDLSSHNSRAARRAREAGGGPLPRAQPGVPAPSEPLAPERGAGAALNHFQAPKPNLDPPPAIPRFAEQPPTSSSA